MNTPLNFFCHIKITSLTSLIFFFFSDFNNLFIQVNPTNHPMTCTLVSLMQHHNIIPIVILHAPWPHMFIITFYYILFRRLVNV
ncbi:hypothetical protein Hanom_Chr08g00724181 [Helianthus anomalus]